MNGGSSNNIKLFMYICALQTNTKFQSNITKDPSDFDLYQPTRFRSHVDSYRIIHSPHDHSVTVPVQYMIRAYV